VVSIEDFIRVLYEKLLKLTQLWNVYVSPRGNSYIVPRSPVRQTTAYDWPIIRNRYFLWQFNYKSKCIRWSAVYSSV